MSNLPCRIKDLDAQQLQNLIDAYENTNELVLSLIKRFNLLASPSVFARNLPLIDTDKHCPYCGGIMQRKVKTRSSYRYHSQILTCKNCKHQIDLQADSKFVCRCAKCNEIKEAYRKQEQQDTENFILNYLSYVEEQAHMYKPLSIYDLNLKLRLFISSMLVKLKFDHKTLCFEPLELNIYAQLSPSLVFTKECLDELIELKVLYVGKNSSFEAFKLYQYQGETQISYDIHKVRLAILLKEFDNFTNKQLNELKNCKYCTDLNAIQIKNMWYSINTIECLEHLKFYTNHIDRSYNAPQKLVTLTYRLLTQFSPGVVCCLFWSVCTLVITNYKQHRLSKEHALNTINNNIEYRADDLLSNKRHYKQSYRNKYLPQSIFSKLFFDYILKLDDDAFSVVCNDEIVDAVLKK